MAMGPHPPLRGRPLPMLGEGYTVWAGCPTPVGKLPVTLVEAASVRVPQPSPGIGRGRGEAAVRAFNVVRATAFCVRIPRPRTPYTAPSRHGGRPGDDDGCGS